MSLWLVVRILPRFQHEHAIVESGHYCHCLLFIFIYTQLRAFREAERRFDIISTLFQSSIDLVRLAQRERDIAPRRALTVSTAIVAAVSSSELTCAFPFKLRWPSLFDLLTNSKTGCSSIYMFLSHFQLAFRVAVQIYVPQNKFCPSVELLSF